MTLSPSVMPGWDAIAPGLDVLLRPDTSNDIVALLVFSPLGSAVENQQDAGIVSFAGRMLMRGTRKLSNAQLAEAIDSMGVSLSCDVSEDYSNMHLVTTSDTLSESLALLSEVFFEPAFEPEEIEKERQNTLAAIRRSEDDLFSLTFERFYRELYPTHGYGLPGMGLAKAVGEFTREQTINSHEELTAGPFRVVAVGNFIADELKTLLLQHFAPRMRTAESARITIPKPVAAPAHRVAFHRDSEQAYLAMGYPAVPPGDPQYFAARVLNAVLGEGMSSRLFSALREDKGLAYATGSTLSANRQAAEIIGYIGTKPESLIMAREGMLAEFERMKTELIPDEELVRAKNYLVGKFFIDHQKNYKRAFYLGHFDQMGLSWQMDDLYSGMIASVTAERVQAVAQRILTQPTVVELLPESA